MRDMNGDDLQWVQWHGTAWNELVKQGYATERVEARHGVKWALMRKAAAAHL
jgi:hypothetical protein